MSRSLAIVGALTVVVAAVVVGMGAVAQTSGSHEARSRDRLPDLVQEVPSELALQVGVVDGRTTYRLGFRSAVANVGAGPLIVAGARRDTGVRSMKVNQVVRRVGQPARVIGDVGRMRYTVSPDHRHWHYLQFDRYELQSTELWRAGSSAPIVKDRKTGFCLGDRYRTNVRLRSAPARPVYTGRCGLERPGLLRMREGISVGYGDDYSAFLEGQDLALDGLPAGRYVLVHRVNGERQLEELSYANNAASVLLDLRWHRGSPSLRVLARCPGTDRCDESVHARTATPGG
jgi:hypothetical protein